MKDKIISSYQNLRWLVEKDGTKTLQQRVLVYNKVDKEKNKGIKDGYERRQEWIDVPEIEDGIEADS